MPIPLTLNSVTYQYPKLGDENWGQDATNWAVGITQLVNSIDTLIDNTIVAGLYELADGSAATPSLRFQNSLTTGIYRGGSNILAFSSAGVQSGQISATGQFQFLDGTAAAPSLSFLLDTDTGIYRIGANQLGFSTNGISAGNINSSGLWTLNSLTVSGSSTLAGASATSLSVSGATSSGSLSVSGGSTLTTVTATVVTLDQINANGYILDEQATATLLDNTTGDVFISPVASNKNFIVDYSLTRSTGKETGQIIMSTDGTNVQVSGNSSTVVDCGVSFSGDINAGNVRLRYTTTSTGSNATMKYVVKRWND